MRRPLEHPGVAQRLDQQRLHPRPHRAEAGAVGLAGADDAHHGAHRPVEHDRGHDQEQDADRAQDDLQRARHVFSRERLVALVAHVRPRRRQGDHRRTRAGLHRRVAGARIRAVRAPRGSRPRRCRRGFAAGHAASRGTPVARGRRSVNRRIRCGACGGGARSSPQARSHAWPSSRPEIGVGDPDDADVESAQFVLSALLLPQHPLGRAAAPRVGVLHAPVELDGHGGLLEPGVDDGDQSALRPGSRPGVRARATRQPTMRSRPRVSSGDSARPSASAAALHAPAAAPGQRRAAAPRRSSPPRDRGPASSPASMATTASSSGHSRAQSTSVRAGDVRRTGPARQPRAAQGARDMR